MSDTAPTVRPRPEAKIAAKQERASFRYRWRQALKKRRENNERVFYARFVAT